MAITSAIHASSANVSIILLCNPYNRKWVRQSMEMQSAMWLMPMQSVVQSLSLSSVAQVMQMCLKSTVWSLQKKWIRQSMQVHSAMQSVPMQSSEQSNCSQLWYPCNFNPSYKECKFDQKHNWCNCILKCNQIQTNTCKILANDNHLCNQWAFHHLSV